MKKYIITIFLIAASTFGIYHTADRILTAPLIIGPFFVFADQTDAYKRSNITETQVGLPVQYVITVVDDNNTTLPGIRLDTWFANAAGLYSGIPLLGTANQDFLRGWQLTDKNGQLTFDAIFPGPYIGRTIHTHLRVRQFADNGTVLYDSTTQLFFSQDIIDEVMGLQDYQAAAAANWNTQNSADAYYTSENVMSLTGDTKKGYVATYTIVLPLGSSIKSSSNSGAGNFVAPPSGGLDSGQKPSSKGLRCLRATSRSRLLSQSAKRRTLRRKRV